MKRRQEVEPAIGHTKHDNGMIRCYLKGSVGDVLNPISCASGYNICWLLSAIMWLGLKGFFALAFLVAARSSLRRFASIAGSTGLPTRFREDHVTLPAYSTR